MHSFRNTTIKILRRAALKGKRLFFGSNVMIDDPYIRYLEYVCGGEMFEKGNVFAWKKVIEGLPDKLPVVEIGAFSGVSTNIITYLLGKQGKKNPFFSVDCWQLRPDDEPFFHKDFNFDHYNDFVRESFIRNTKCFSAECLPNAIQETSKSFFEYWRRGEVVTDVFGRSAQLGGEIGFCFIDGDHSYAGVKQDFLDANEFLVRGGFLLFDDSSDGSGWDDINRLMSEIARRGDYNLVMKNPNFLFKKL